MAEESSPPAKLVGDDAASSIETLDSQKQAGVQGIEAISLSWTQTSLIVAYLGYVRADLIRSFKTALFYVVPNVVVVLLHREQCILDGNSQFIWKVAAIVFLFLVVSCTSLESQTTTNLTAYATSAFAQHSLVATVLVVQGVVNAVIKPPMAKIANVFGRLESFTLSVTLYVLGYIQQAGSNNVRAFASAQIFYSAGSQGLQILQQIFIADTTDLLNRALFSSLPDVPFLWTTWAGAPLAGSVRHHAGWRWGYGIWAIVLPVAFIPLALSLFLNARKAKKLNLLPPPVWRGQSVSGALKHIWFQLDVMGLLLLAAAISLILIPLTLAAKATGKWHNGSIIAMLVFGCVCLVLFPLWESSSKLAPYPFIRLSLLRNRTVLAGCVLGFFYFAVFYTSIQPYFFSYLQVVHSQSLTAAGHITQTFSFTSTVSSIVVSLFIKYTRHYKYYITAGACIYLVGIGIMMRYRTESSSIAQIVGTQICIGIGGGMVNVPAQLGVQASASHADVAAVTAIFLTVVEIGGAVGSAISGAIWTGNLLPKLEQYLPPASSGDAAAIFGNLTLAASFPLTSPERRAINRSYQETMNLLLIVAACFAAPILPLSLVMRNIRLDAVDQKVKGVVIGKSDWGASVSEGVAEEHSLGATGTGSSAAAAQSGKKHWLARIKQR